MTKRFLTLAGPLFLCACGGGSSGISVDPIAASGFAGEAGVDVTASDTFSVSDQQFTQRPDGGSPSFTQASLQLTGSIADETITFQVDDRTFELTRDPDEFDEYVFETEDDLVVIEFFTESPPAQAINLFMISDSVLTDGYFIVGYDTDPRLISAQTGTATFAGEVDITMRRDDFIDAFGSGTATFTADFDANSLSGNASVVQDNQADADFTFPALTYEFVTADIVDNGFEGGLEYDDGGSGGELIQGNYEGRFFGEEGETLAGTFTSQIGVDVFEDDIFLTGYFFTQKADE